MNIQDEYFEWLYQTINGKKNRLLLATLHDIDFHSDIELDENRISDGLTLRSTFAEEVGVPISVVDIKLKNKKCSVLEMMIGLALRIEHHIMEDVDFGDRTTMWFSIMLKSLGIDSMNDSEFDEDYVRDVIDLFLDRKYWANGKGGLFTVYGCEKDMRSLDIWYQMCIFFDKLL